MNPGKSWPLAYVSPSSYEVLRDCRLRKAFAQQSPPGHSVPALRLGAACHRILCQLAEGRVIPAQLDSRLKELWRAEIEREAAASKQAGEWALFGPPESWPGIQLKRARLRRAAGWLAALLASLPAGADVRCELDLQGAGGRLRGKIDLAVRSGGVPLIADYKTGAALERDSLQIVGRYRRQLLLYAALEHEATSQWPATAWLVPLEGKPEQVEVDPVEAAGTVADALALLDAYNSAAPGAQPASPAPGTCSACGFASRCPAFWAACDASWAPDLLAVRGEVASVMPSTFGGRSLVVVPRGGSLGHEPVRVRGVSDHAFAGAAGIAPGAEVAISGLRADPSGGCHVPGLSASLSISQGPPDAARFPERAGCAGGMPDEEAPTALA